MTKSEMSNFIYEWSMVLIDSNAKGVDEFIEMLCKHEGIEYPPKQIEKANQRPVNAGN